MGESGAVASLESFDGDALQIKSVMGGGRVGNDRAYHDEDAGLKMTTRRVYIRNRAGRGGYKKISIRTC